MNTLPRLLLVTAALLIPLTSLAEPVTNAVQQQPIAGYLGMGVDKVPVSVRAHLPDDVGKTQGLLVTQFADESPAADDGIKLYDVLISYDGKPIEDPEKLIQQIRQDKPGRVVIFKVLRQGVVLNVAITMGRQKITPAVPVQQMQTQQRQVVQAQRIQQRPAFAARPWQNSRPTYPRNQHPLAGNRYPAYRGYAKPSYPMPQRAMPQRPYPTPNYKAPQIQPPHPLQPTTPALNIAGKPAYPMRKKFVPEKHAWGDKRNIWDDFYTGFTGDMWDSMINAPFDIGRMPGGWRAPSLSTPDPVTIGDAVTNQIPPMLEEMGNMTDFSN